MQVDSRSLLIRSSGSISDSASSRPSASLRHYIPIFFLAPSMVILVHAWNRTGPPEPRVFVELELGGYEFPRDVHLHLRWAEDKFAAVEGRRASFPAPAPGPVTLTLFVSRPDGEMRVPVGEPREFRLEGREAPNRWIFPLAASTCVRAMKEVRAAR